MKQLSIYAFILFVMFSGCSKANKTVEQLENFYNQLAEESTFVTVEGVPVAQKTRFVRPGDVQVPDSLELKQIALIRHGEPSLTKTGRFNYEEAKEYMKSYDSVGIFVPDEPFFQVEEEEEILFYVSNLNRAKTTADYLFGPERERVESEEFREFERSLGNRHAPISLPLRYWSIRARLEWYLGINRDGIESFAEAKERAKRGAIKLDVQSQEHDKIVLVAHGFLNRYIEKYLKEQGWQVVRDGGMNYFATTILVKVEEASEAASVAKID
jgi:broad specificity phosphatase PhoE